MYTSIPDTKAEMGVLGVLKEKNTVREIHRVRGRERKYEMDGK